MKIASIANFIPETHHVWGGAEKAASLVVSLLRKNEEEVFVLGTAPDKKDRPFPYHAIRTLEDVIGKMPSAYIKFWYPLDAVSFFSAMRLLRRLQPDVVHLHNFNVLSLSVIAAAKFLKLPVVFSVYDYWTICPKITLIKKDGALCHDFHGEQCFDCLDIKRFKTFQWISSKLRKKIFNYFIRRIDAWLVLSQASGDIIHEYGIPKEKIKVVPLALFDKPENSGVAYQKNTLFFAGWIEPNKGVHVLLSAFKLVLEEIPEATLYLLGMESDMSTQSYVNKINSFIKDNGLGKRIIRKGRTPREEFYALLDQAQVVVVPEQWENMSPVILIESLSRGKAVVAGNIGGIPEFVRNGESGFLAEYNNPADFAEKIVSLLRDPERAKTFGENAKSSMKRIFDEGEIISKLKDVYNAVSRPS